jgi:anthranilate phosphoribosyltransferase
MPELLGFRDALIEMCIPIDLEDRKAIDIVGTGGDGKNTFNISTLSCFIVAGAGQMVAKHGSYGASSVSGASNLMDHIGYKFKNNQDVLRNELDQTNMCFLHAPIFHPALKVVAPIRKNLKVRTFFNMLGPMVNPSFPKNQLVGVFSLELVRIYAYLYQKTNVNYAILHALDGYDEISLTGDAKMISRNTESIINPNDFKLSKLQFEAIKGGETIEQSASIFMNIISGNGTEAQQNIVCANAALAIATVEKSTILDAFAKAKESLQSGKALEKLKKLQQISQA